MLSARAASSAQACQPERSIPADEEDSHVPHTNSSQKLVSSLLREREWRERVVEEFVFGAGEHVRVSATFQCGLSASVMSDHLAAGESVVRGVPLPITTREKRPLLNFDLRGPEGRDCFLLPRDQIGALQTGYLQDRLADAGLEDVNDVRTTDLLEGICTFTPAVFQFVRAEADGDQDRALVAYLNDGLGLDGIKPADVRRWRQRTGPARRALIEALQEPASAASSAEEVLLALPHMLRPPKDAGEVDELVESYCGIVQALVRGKATEALYALADSGRRWVVIVETTVRIGERFTVKLSEDRPLALRARRLSRQRFALGDADRAHLEIRMTDSNVMLGREPARRDPQGEEVAIGVLEGVRFTNETASYYSSIADRPRFLDLDIDLKLTSDLRLMPMLVSVLGLAATVICLLLPAGQDLVTGIAVMAVPITVAAALLAVREQTALASRLQQGPRACVVIVTALLWASVLLRLLWSGVALPPWQGSSRSHRQTAAIPSRTGEGADGKERTSRQRAHRGGQRP